MTDARPVQPAQSAPPVGQRDTEAPAADVGVADYQPSDRLYLWWLGEPDQPRYVGELMMARSLKGVSLRYDEGWVQSGFALSEDLPLTATEHLPRAKETAAGAVDDARPDRWGERVIAYLDKPPRRALLDLLWFCGEERFGALGVSVSGDRYLPRRIGPLPQLRDVGEMEQLIQRIFSGEPVAEPQRRLIAPGVTMGGARPKGLMLTQGSQWVVKFSEPGEDFDTPLVEHASLTLCQQAGIRVAESFPISLGGRGHAVAVKRFDRTPQGRIHGMSAGVALRAAGQEFGYPELAQLLRRLGPAGAEQRGADMKELFRRMVANILLDNTDDHERNHVLLAEDLGAWRLSPAFDVLPTGQALGYQQMRVGVDGHDSTLDNAVSEARQFGLTADDARGIVREVVRVIDGWAAHFRQVGVSNKDIAYLAQQIDRPALRTQREAYAR